MKAILQKLDQMQSVAASGIDAPPDVTIRIIQALRVAIERLNTYATFSHLTAQATSAQALKEIEALFEEKK